MSHDNAPIAVYSNTRTKRPGVLLPFAAFVVIDVLAVLLALAVWR